MKVLSLFNGMSVGRLALPNVNSYYSSEIEESSIKVTKDNHDDVIELGDVTKWKEWDTEVFNVDLLIGGSPCQGFSRQGVGLNFEDTRSKLFFEFVEILELIKSEYNPNVKFMLENVDMKKEWEDVITENIGVKPIKINSDLFVPQNRPRTYWTNIDFELPECTRPQLINILDDVMLMDYRLIGGIKVCNSFNCDSQDLLSVVEGEVRIKQPVKLGYAVAEPGDGINISFPTSKTRRGRVIKERSSCLDTSCDIGVYDQHGQIRRFTINELERLQGLPEGYTKVVSQSKAKQMLGNGWTLPVIKHILGGMKNV